MKKLIIFMLMGFVLIGSAFGQTLIATDDFECGAFNCGAGWTGAWVYSGTCEVLDTNAIDSYNMRGVSGCDALKNLDTTGYSQVNISFYATAGSLEAADTCSIYYNDGTTDHLLLTLVNGDDDNTHDYYEFDITSYGLNSNAGIRFTSPSTPGDYCYLDNVQFNGVIATDLNLFVEENYLADTTGVTIEATSSITNTQHTIELAYPNGTIFCSDTITSPAIAYTAFSTSCNMPNEVIVNATAKLYLTGTPAESVTEYFNVVILSHDDTKLKIEKVYHSPQVLQGGQTEIFALLHLGNNITVNKATVTLTYPDVSTRVFYMEPTQNPDEYKALITDTYQVGNVLFTIYIETDIYYAQYSNQYTVAAYNVDFVDVVNQVAQVAVCQDVNESEMALFGTEYEVYEHGTIFLQLSDGQGIPVNDGDCHLDVYYPDLVNQSHPIFIDNAPMIYKTDSSGLYYYDFVLGNVTGVYMLSATCAYAYSSVWAYTEDDTEGPVRNVTAGTYTGSTHNLISHVDFLYQECTSSGGSPKSCDSYYDFNLTGIDTSNITDINLYYSGEASSSATLTLYVWNWTSSSWIELSNQLSFSGVSPSGNPIGINDFVGNAVPVSNTISNDIIRIRLYGASGSTYTQFDNWVNLKVLTAEGTITDLKGGGEIHVSSAMTDMGNFIVDQFSYVPNNVWNHSPNRTLTTPSQQWIGGTEYSEEEQVGKIVVRAMDPNGEPLISADCDATIYYPNNTIYLNSVDMNEAGGIGGVYYLDFNLSGVPGVHPYGIDCAKGGKNYYMLNTYHVFDQNLTHVAQEVWGYDTRTLTNLSNVAGDVWGGNYTINAGLLSQIVGGVWDYVSRYTHGIIN